MLLYDISGLVRRRRREDGFTLLVSRLRVRAGARLAITGPSGCGKSTALDLLGLALAPDSAEKFLYRPNGESIDIMELWRRKRLDRLAAIRLASMGYVLQTGGLLPYLNVLDNILLTARLAGLDPARARDEAERQAGMLDINHLLAAMPATLSVGERQRVAIARALTPGPALVLADEPTAALDPVRADDVMLAFLKALETTGGTLILVTHNRDWALRAGFIEAPVRTKITEDGVMAVLEYAGDDLE